MKSQHVVGSALLVTSFLFGGCGPLIPDGPNGGENRFELTVVGEAVPFDEAIVSGSGSNQIVTLSFSGSGYANDELYAAILSLTLARSELEALVGAERQPIATHIATVTDRQGRAIERSVSVPGTSPALLSLQYAMTRETVFESVLRRSQGTLDVTFFDHFSIAGSLEVEIDRASLGRGALNHSVKAAFDVPLPVRH